VGVKAALDRRAFREALAHAREPRRILDVGGGRGDMGEAFIRAAGGGLRATVVDLDEQSIAAARRRGLEGFAGRFEDFETDERFDVVLLLNLIEHVADPLLVLRRARDLLAPGGVIWLQTPNFRSLDASLFRHRNWAGLHCPRHWVLFSEAGLRAALDEAALDPIRLRRAQAGAFWAASLLGLPRARRPSPPVGPDVKPLVRYRGFLPLAAAGAAFDFATRRVRRTSQLVALVRARASR
jgi:SAM-dependent methyltransferase